MVDWILDPCGIDLGGYLVLWIALLVMLPVVLVAGAVRAARDRNSDREA